jgi:hypothetical protein
MLLLIDGGASGSTVDLLICCFCCNAVFETFRQPSAAIYGIFNTFAGTKSASKQHLLEVRLHISSSTIYIATRHNVKSTCFNGHKLLWGVIWWRGDLPKIVDPMVTTERGCTIATPNQEPCNSLPLTTATMLFLQIPVCDNASGACMGLPHMIAEAE